MASSTSNSDIKVTLYWLEQSRAQSILWVLEALSVPYQLKTFKRRPDKLAPKELKEIHPLGKSPVISIERPEFSEPLILAESGAIVEYLLDHFGGEEKGLVPKRYATEDDKAKGIETEEWLRYRFYMHYIEGSLMPHLVTALIIDGIRTFPVPFFVKPITSIVANRIQASWLDKQFAVHFPFLENQVKTAPGTSETKKGGICGPTFTAADMLMSFPVIASTKRGIYNKTECPELAAYADRMENDPGYQRAVKKIEQVEGKFVSTL